jgi:CopG family transcriptional regulator / antitoxin EndoAI
MSKRINIMLPEKTLAVLDRAASRGNRSSFVSRAVLHYVETQGKKSLREQLKTGYLANADENLKIAAEWFPLEEEAWQKNAARRRAKSKK